MQNVTASREDIQNIITNVEIMENVTASLEEIQNIANVEIMENITASRKEIQNFITNVQITVTFTTTRQIQYSQQHNEFGDHYKPHT